MARIAFIGLGMMGLPLAQNLLAVGHAVTGFDVRSLQVSRLESMGGRSSSSVAQAVADADFILSSLPDAVAVKSAFQDNPDVIKAVRKGAIWIDTSVVGIDAARSFAAFAEISGITALDAPIIGDSRDAKVRMITFAVGGSMAAYTEAKPILSDMSDRVLYVGKSGMGQATVLCTELMTAINMIGAAEAFALAEKLGLPAEKLFEAASLSTASSWSLIDRCPQSGLVPEAPSNNLYHGGTPAARILHFLRLIEQAGGKVDARLPLTTPAVDLYAEFCDTKDLKLDFSAIIQILRRR